MMERIKEKVKNKIDKPGNVCMKLVLFFFFCCCCFRFAIFLFFWQELNALFLNSCYFQRNDFLILFFFCFLFFENLLNKKSLDRSAVNPVLSVSFHLILDHEMFEENKSNEKVEYKIITTMADIRGFCQIVFHLILIL